MHAHTKVAYQWFVIVNVRWQITIRGKMRNLKSPGPVRQTHVHAPFALDVFLKFSVRKQKTQYTAQNTLSQNA
jgi:hypothetical protein